MTDDHPNTAFVYLYLDVDDYKKRGRVFLEEPAEPVDEERTIAEFFE